MTLIVETGHGISDANSYVSLIEADTYHSLYNNTDWAGTDEEKEQALILATRSLDLLYGPKYLSFKRVNSVSPLLFPRMVFYDNNQVLVDDYVIPKCIKDATCQIALMYLQGIDIFPLANTDNTIKQNSIKIGDIQVSNTYNGMRGQTELYSSFGTVDYIVFPVLRKRKTTINFRL